MSKRRAASSNEGNGHGSAVDTSRKDLASSKPNATRRRDRNNVGAIVLSLLMAVAAITAIYWATTGGTRTKPAPPNVALRDLALQLMNPSKGILAADESPATLGKRLSSATLNTRTVRHNWRRTILTAAGLEEHISGVILHEETFIHAGTDVRSASSRGLLVGIKLDKGTVLMLPKHVGEHATQGLDGLDVRCERFRDRGGAVFAKWRAVFKVGRHTPSRASIRRNAADLADYAARVQRCGLLPILEPEVLAEGDHDLQRAAAASARVLRGVFRALRRRPEVDPGAILLKVAFVTAGRQAPEQAEPHEVANATLRVLLRTVPRVIPGIVFLSGGQSEEAATANLLALSQLAQERLQAGKTALPWALSFSFGRALQASALEAWQRGDVREAQALLVQRARINALAQQGLQEALPLVAAATTPVGKPDLASGDSGRVAEG